MDTASRASHSEILYRNFRTTAAALQLGHGMTDAESDAAMREAFAAWYAGRCLETVDPRASAQALSDAVQRHLDNQGLSAAVRLPARRAWSRIWHWQRTAKVA